MEHNFCDTCGDFTLLVKSNCSSCDAKARAKRDSWEQSNVCSRCEGKLDQHAIESDNMSAEQATDAILRYIDKLNNDK